MTAERHIKPSRADTPSIDYGPSQDFAVHRIVNGGRAVWIWKRCATPMNFTIRRHSLIAARENRRRRARCTASPDRCPSSIGDGWLMVVHNPSETVANNATLRCPNRAFAAL